MKSVKVEKLPTCDFCNDHGITKKAEYDAKTNIGPWANMCLDHFNLYGIGLGLGKGQKLIKK